jgi:hypothetical protein
MKKQDTLCESKFPFEKVLLYKEQVLCFIIRKNNQMLINKNWT